MKTPGMWRAVRLSAIAAALAVVGAFAVGPRSSVHAQPPPSPQCGSLNTGLSMLTGSLWVCGGDLVAQSANPTNGGTAGDTTFSSSHVAVKEECVNNSTCGRGEFGYGGGELPFGSVLLNNLDPTTSNDTFACPTSATAQSNPSTAQASATTGTNGSTPPALILHPGNFAGGNGASGNGNVSADVQCYNPYEANPGGSAAMGSSYTAPGKAYEAQCIGNSCATGAGSAKRALEAAFYVPENSSAASSCKGKVVVAGGWDGSTDLTSAWLYDPRATINGVSNQVSGGFNQWSSLSPTSPAVSSLIRARDTPDVVQLTSTRWMLLGGEANNSDTVTNSYEIFDSTLCGFLPVTTAPGATTMSTNRYDFAAAKFGAFGSDVLACGGTVNVTTFADTNTCDLFQQNTAACTAGPSASCAGGSWSASATLNFNRAGDFAQFLPSNGSILIAGGDDAKPPTTVNGSQTSEECSETGHTVTCANVGVWDSSSADLGYTPQVNNAVLDDASHVLIGWNAAEDVGSGTSGNTSQLGYSVSPMNELVLACGDFGIGGNAAGGNDTGISCEYYVPSGTTAPSQFKIAGSTYHCGSVNGTLNTAGSGRGPTWCTTAGSHFTRERVYFNLSEVPTCSGCPSGGVTADSFVAAGGFYGTTNNFQEALTRKNVEILSKGTA